MDQQKIGAFIATRRKQKGWSQKQLAEALNISDKTISKWETGRGLPEVSCMLPLCHLLNINVNELLSGEILPQQAYYQKAEENILHLYQTESPPATSPSASKIIHIGILFCLAATYLLLVDWWFLFPRILFAAGLLVMLIGVVNET